MTPERRAEIEAAYDGSVKGAVRELLAEIDRLNKVVDQAIRYAHISQGSPEDDDGGDRTIKYAGNEYWFYASVTPELAAELERRSKA